MEDGGDARKKLEVAQQFRNLADANFNDEKLGDAFFYYLHSLKLYPNWKAELKERFFVVLSCWGQLLELRNNYLEIFHIYKEALEVYPDCAELFNNLGAHLLRLGRADESVLYFKQALQRDTSFFPAYRNLHSASCALVERWHYRMLNDACRNEAYRTAIANKVSQGFNTVLDIGTGTGLFCLYAHEAGAEKIYGCDYNQTMIRVALQVLHKLGLLGRVKILNNLSNNLLIPRDLLERVSLVVTETLDSCMLGEQILRTLNDAWKHLLKPPAAQSNCAERGAGGGAVIPHSGSLWLRLVQSARLAKNYVFPLVDGSADDCATTLEDISLLADGGRPKAPAAVCAAPRELRFGRLALRASSNEPYDTERLQELADCAFLSAPYHLLRVDFNDPAQIEAYLGSRNSLVFEVTCAGAGYLHAIAAWFDVRLDERDDGVGLSSAPDGPNAARCCWEQAIFPVARPVRVFAGSRVSMCGDWTEGKVSLQAQLVTHPSGGAASPVAEAVLAVSAACVAALNDRRLLEHLQASAVEFARNCAGRGRLRLMDLYPVPVFGLAVLGNLRLAGMECADAELVCAVRSAAEEECVRRLAKGNDIAQDCLRFVNVEEFDAAANGADWQRSFDAILVNFLEPDGVVNEEAVCRVQSLKSLLKANGTLLPKKIVINGHLVYSDFIERSMRVVDENITKYGISEFINEFQVPQLLDVNVATLKYDRFSNTCLFCACAPENLDEKFQESHAVLATRGGTVNSILCWFDLSVLDDSSRYSSLHDFAYVHQTAFLPKTPIAVQLNDYVTIDFVYHHGAFLMSLKKCDIDA